VLVCASEDIVEGGPGVRFPVLSSGHAATAFVVRYHGQPRAYLNRCAHVPIELDWEKGTFFESSGLYLMCATHGAIYLPDTGACAGGPCRGGRLRPVVVREEAGKIFWQPDQQIQAPTN
jgi:nitrite reductase/ring-hydroxylating ferredoxin subunit